MKKFIVIVLDGFGVGEMADVKETRPQDAGANTCLHILNSEPDLKLNTLASLGLMNIIGQEVNGMKFSTAGTWGRSNLMHFGADTFMGHQEIMGTKPVHPFTEPMKNRINEIYDELKKNNFSVRYSEGYKEKFLIVNNALTVADNIECDLGQAFNVTSAIDLIPFSEVLKVGRIVRKIAKVPRVITFGGEGVTLENILNAVEEKPGGYIGINAPKSGVYNKGYHCIHMGYGVDPNVQVPTILGKAGIPVYLLGKAADVINNDYGMSISMVDTDKVLEETIKISKKLQRGFICCNVQETDLAGHSQNVKRYAEKLKIADRRIGELEQTLDEGDIMIVMADHGNDPTIGHNKHTREKVPLMIAGKNLKHGFIGECKTLSDVGATISDYFSVHKPENGTSFLKKLVKVSNLD